MSPLGRGSRGGFRKTGLGEGVVGKKEALSVFSHRRDVYEVVCSGELRRTAGSL